MPLALGKCSFCHMCSTVMGNKPRSTAPFLTQLDIAQVPPPQAGEGDGLDGLEAPCDAFVYSSVTLPLLQNELPRVAKFLCSVPAPVQPSITDVIFSPSAQVAEVSPLCLQLELCHHPDRSAVAFVISNQRQIIVLLEEWSTKRFCKLWELESLNSHLYHACKVAPQGEQ